MINNYLNNHVCKYKIFIVLETFETLKNSLKIVPENFELLRGEKRFLGNALSKIRINNVLISWNLLQIPDQYIESLTICFLKII